MLSDLLVLLFITVNFFFFFLNIFIAYMKKTQNIKLTDTKHHKTSQI